MSENKIAVGVLYQDKKSVPQIDRQLNRTKVKTEVYEETRQYDVSGLLAKFR